MMDVVLAAYDLKESIIIEDGAKLIICLFLRNAIKMMLQHDKEGTNGVSQDGKTIRVTLPRRFGWV